MNNAILTGVITWLSDGMRFGFLTGEVVGLVAFALSPVPSGPTTLTIGNHKIFGSTSASHQHTPKHRANYHIAR